MKMMAAAMATTTADTMIVVSSQRQSVFGRTGDITIGFKLVRHRAYLHKNII